MKGFAMKDIAMKDIGKVICAICFFVATAEILA